MHPDITQLDFTTLSLASISDTNAYSIHPFLKDFPVNNNIYESIQLAGLLSPPIVQEAENTAYNIICGRQRIRCLELLGVKHCYCQILPKSLQSENILAIVLEDQFVAGPLNLIEQACFIELCQNYIPEKHRFRSFIQNLLPGRITKGVHFLRPLATLEETLQYKVHIGSISEKILPEMLNLSKENQNQFIFLVDTLQLGLNNQKKVIQKLDDIIKRENISLAQFLDQERIREILHDSRLDSTQRTAAFLTTIQRLHQPRFSAAHNEFTERIKSLKLPRSCSLSPSQSFENSAVTLSVHFNTYERFAEKWAGLREILDEE